MFRGLELGNGHVALVLDNVKLVCGEVAIVREGLNQIYGIVTLFRDNTDLIAKAHVLIAGLNVRVQTCEQIYASIQVKDVARYGIRLLPRYRLNSDRAVWSFEERRAGTVAGFGEAPFGDPPSCRTITMACLSVSRPM